MHFCLWVMVSGIRKSPECHSTWNSQVGIQDFASWSSSFGGWKMPMYADVEKWSRANKASYLWPMFSIYLRAVETSEFLMLKITFFHTSETPFLSFQTFCWILNTYKNSTLYFNQFEISLHTLCKFPFFYLHENILPLINFNYSK